MREPTFQAMREALSTNACAETTDWKDGVSVEAASCPFSSARGTTFRANASKKKDKYCMGDQSREFRRAHLRETNPNTRDVWLMSDHERVHSARTDNGGGL